MSTLKIKSKDGITTKTLVHLLDGTVEVASVEHPSGKHIICVPTQMGCAQGCRFCVSGKRRFIRNLSGPEIAQCVYGCAQSPNVYNSNYPLLVSAMGEGEPLSNAEAVLTAFELIARHYHASSTRYAVSTTAPDARILEWFILKCPRPLKIQFSLHTLDYALRHRLMPGAGSLELALAALEPYKDIVDLNFTLLKGVNDDIDSAALIAQKLQGWHIKLNQFNLSPDIPFQPTPKEEALTFYTFLKDKGLDVEQYATDGSDIQAACGQMSYDFDKD